MDDYYKIAYDYFQAFEGKKLYPNLSPWYLLALGSTLAVLWLISPLGPIRTMNLPDWAFAAALGPLLYVVISVSEKRKASLMAKVQAAAANSIADLKRL